MAFHHQSSLTTVLLFCLWSRISTEQCETYAYEPPVTTFSIKNGTSQTCGFNGAKVFYNVTDSRSGETNFSVTVNGTLCIGEYIFEVNTFNYTHTRQKFFICTDARNGSLFTRNANVSYVVLKKAILKNCHF